MSAPTSTRLQSESYPPTTSRQLFRQLDSAIDDAEIAIARHFRGFATAIRDKLPVLLGPFVELTLDEYADAVDDVLGPELEQLRRELAITVSLVTRKVMDIGARQGQSLIGSIIVDWDIDNPEVDRFLRKHVLDLTTGLDDTTRARLAVVIRRGVREGQGVAQIQREIMDVAKRMSAERSRLIAQTEVLRAMNAGANEVYRKSGLVRGVRFIDGQYGACPACRALNGKVIKLGESFEAQIGNTTLSAPYPPIHPACLTGDAHVAPGGRITGATQRWYEGDVLLIRTAGGNELTITPNHPVLGLSGWFPAKLMHPGSYVICGTGIQRMIVSRPNGEYEPSTIEQVFRSLVGSREMTARSVPCAAEDFHGDGFCGDVDVVGADRQLRGYGQTQLAEPVSQLNLSGRAIAEILLPSPRLSFGLCGALGDTGSSMGGPGLIGSLLRCHPQPLHAFGLGLPTGRDVVLQENPSNSRPSESEVFRYPVLRDATDVHPDQVVSVEVSPFRGHVYNLETEQSWYSGNGVIVHNCRCTTAPILEEVTV